MKTALVSIIKEATVEVDLGTAQVYLIAHGHFTLMQVAQMGDQELAEAYVSHAEGRSVMPCFDTSVLMLQLID